MKRVIPVVILLAGVVAAGVYFYPRLVRKPAPINQLTLSGNIEAHESLVGFKVRGALSSYQSKRVNWGAGALLARLDDAATSNERASTKPRCGSANRI